MSSQLLAVILKLGDQDYSSVVEHLPSIRPWVGPQGIHMLHHTMYEVAKNGNEDGDSGARSSQATGWQIAQQVTACFESQMTGVLSSEFTKDSSSIPGSHIVV